MSSEVVEVWRRKRRRAGNWRALSEFVRQGEPVSDALFSRFQKMVRSL